jgi:hypothetical protein
MKKIFILAIFLLFVQNILIQNAEANRRRFAYVYESPVLPKGARELELWNTLRLNKANWYRGLDNRTEFEFGLGGNLQTSLYLNLTSEATFDGTNVSHTGTEFGISNEWKYKALDRVADPIGIGLYVEGGLVTDEVELEGKLILDKQMDKFLVAFNAVGEKEYEYIGQNGAVDAENATKLEFDLGACYLVTPEFGVGLEARNHAVMTEANEKDVTYSALFVGPSLSYAGDNWWVVLAMMPQVTGKSGDADVKYDFVEHEKFEARLLLSFDF